MFNKKLSPELQAILDEANSRGSLVDGHPDLRRTSPEAERTQYVAIRPFHTVPQGKPDPRSMGPQPQPLQAGYAGAAHEDP
jgi:hypothetical protein